MKINFCCVADDIEKRKGSTKDGLKEKLSYFEQFIMLAMSIRKQIKNVDYEIYLFTSHNKEYYLGKKQNILDNLNVNIVYINSFSKKRHIRCEIFNYDNYEGDFIVMIDSDTLFIKDFDKKTIEYLNKFDGLGTPSRQLISRKIIKCLCKEFKLKLPDQIDQLPIKGNNKWDVTIYNKHLNNELKEKPYPYFNNGFIFIKKNILKEFGKKYKNVIEKNNLQNRKYVNDQWIVGLAMISSTDNWNVLPSNLNFCLNKTLNNLNSSIDILEKKNNIIHIHYINLDFQSNVFEIYIKEYYEKVKLLNETI